MCELYVCSMSNSMNKIPVCQRSSSQRSNREGVQQVQSHSPSFQQVSREGVERWLNGSSSLVDDRMHAMESDDVLEGVVDGIESTSSSKDGEDSAPSSSHGSMPSVDTTFRVLCTANNTHVTIRWYDAQVDGMRQRTKSTGSCGFKGTKRGTPYAAEQVAQALARQALSTNMRPSNRVHVLLDGNGRGRSVITKGIVSGGLEIASISDVTGVPHGGCRPKKARRV